MLPSLRIGYVVIPRDLVERFVSVRASMDIFPPYLYQEVLTDFMNLGHFGRHLRKMRELYRERRTVLVENLKSEFGDLLEVHGTEAGMHLTVTLPKGMRDREVAEKAAKNGLWVWPLSPCYFGKKPRQGLILGFGSTPSYLIPRAVSQLRSLLDR
jgi:GntR family transcriptional regulator/MocR family aminotransferase